MARVLTLKQKVAEIVRKYEYVNKARFVYNKPSDLKGGFNRIKLWILIHSSEKGHSIFSFSFRRKPLFTVPEWTRYFKEPLEGYKTSLYDTITQALLPAINNSRGSDWTFTALIAWTRADDIRQGKNSPGDSAGDKTTNKRNANARNPARRRQRNKKRKTN